MLVVDQFTITDAKRPRRPDLIVFINGLPLFYINGLPLFYVELKNPADETTDVWEAYNQIEFRRSKSTSLAPRGAIEGAVSSVCIRVRGVEVEIHSDHGSLAGAVVSARLFPLEHPSPLTMAR
jgi:hypothetical protein